MNLQKIAIILLFAGAAAFALTGCSGGGDAPTAEASTGSGAKTSVSKDGQDHAGHDHDHEGHDHSHDDGHDHAGHDHDQAGDHAGHDHAGHDHGDDLVSQKGTTTAVATNVRRERGTPRERKTGGASIEFDELSHEFGKMYEGESKAWKFYFTNVGDESLVISRVKTTCGCTVPSKPEEPIPPGESGAIEIAFNSAKKVGDQKKDISVFTNDPEKPMLKLRVEANVVRQFWIEPPRILLGNLTRSQTVDSKSVKIRWADEIDVKIKDIKPSDPSIKVTQEPFEDTTGKGVELNIEFGKVSDLLSNQRSGVPMQRVNASIAVTTDNPQFPRENIVISGAVIPEVTLRPRVLSFGVLSKDAKPVQKKIILTAARDFEMLPPTVESELDYLDFEIRTIRAGMQYQIVATLDPAKANSGQFRESITIRTNSEEFAENEIPAFGKIK